MIYLYWVLATVILLMVFFFIFKSITSTRYWRIKTNLKAYNKEKIDNEKAIIKMAEKTEEFLSDENRILEVISKIHNGEEVEIPYVAFEYIYRRMGTLGTVDTNGNVRILNFQQFDEFKKLLKNEDEEENYVEYDNVGSNLVFDIKKYDDGTITKKDKITKELTVVKTDGTRLVNNFENNEVLLDIKEEEKENNKNNNQRNNIDSETEIKKLKRKVNQSEEKNAILQMQLNNKQNNEKKEIKKNTDIEENNETKTTENISIKKCNELKEKTESKKEQVLVIKNEEGEGKDVILENTNTLGIKSSHIVVPVEKSLSVTSIDIKNYKQTRKGSTDGSTNEEIVKDLTLTNNVDDKKSEIPLVEDINNIFSKIKTQEQKVEVKNEVAQEEIIEKNPNNKKSSLSNLLDEVKKEKILDREKKFTELRNLKFDDTDKFIESFFTFRTGMDFITQLITIADQEYIHNFIYDEKNKKILISVDMFLFKIYMHLNDETKKKFIETVKPYGERKKGVSNDLVYKLIYQLNKVLSIKYGSKPFYLNEEKKIFILEKYLTYISDEDEESEYFKGLFLQLNLKNSIGEKLQEEGYIKKINPNFVFEIENEDDVNFKQLNFYSIRVM